MKLYKMFIYIIPFLSNLLLTAQCLPICLDHERISLLKFKQTFSINKRASQEPFAHAKTQSWGRETSDCCSWDGVECSNETRHVIGLDLSSSFLYGSIDSNSTLFELVHLRNLSLADNNFNYSRIPSSFEHLSKLASLNLFQSVFSGQIPLAISRLSKLCYLDLSGNVDPVSNENLLLLQTPDFKGLIQNMTSLVKLHLSNVDISSTIPDSLTNLSSLVELAVRSCKLSGLIPSSFGKLSRLSYLDLSKNRLGGQISLFRNFTQMEYLVLSNNDFSNGTLSWVSNMSLTKLVYLDLANCSLFGQLPASFSNLINVKIIYLQDNDLSGKVDFDMFLSLKNLFDLDLARNRVEVVTKPSTTTNTTLPQFKRLNLRMCSLKTFPDFLRYQKRMRILILSGNQIGGKIPKWFFNVSVESLFVLGLGQNFLTGFELTLTYLPWLNLGFVLLDHNMLNSTLPIPSKSTLLYVISDNNLRGKVSPLICNSHSLVTLDLSNNNLDGELPQCLGNFSDSLSFLDLSNNSFVGEIPETFSQRNQLRAVDLGYNRLKGRLPRSLANCAMLEYIGVQNNQLHDMFPFWLGKLPELRVLVLRNNTFNGNIGDPPTDSEFPNLRIIDVSYNSFVGKLPSKYIESLRAMKNSGIENEPGYMESTVHTTDEMSSFSFPYSVTITIKGIGRRYEKIQNALAVVDFSNNKFSGRIPEAFAELKGLHSLDLSNNSLTGAIPSSLGSLSELESLDISRNMLAGPIPHELTSLNFLQYFNVSHNNLVGPIPQENQLSRFDNSSYQGNLGLCGLPLSNKCGNHPEDSAEPSSTGSEKDWLNFGWRVVAIGYAAGFVAGVLLGKLVLSRRPRWFSTIYRVRI